MPVKPDSSRLLVSQAATGRLSRSSRSLEVSVMNVIGAVTATVITGFAVYRWWTGDVFGALINLLIIIMVFAALWLGKRRRFQPLALNLFGVTISAACLLSSLLVSSNGLLWAFLVLWVNALILSRRWALGLNALIILVLTSSLSLYQSLLHQVSWTTVALLMTGFGLMFTDQLREQRRLLASQARIDPLTGVGNRRLMQEHLEDITAERRRDRRVSTLLVLDLDMFKEVNDRHGHEVGDEVLAAFADSVAAALRTEDGLYRMGGEEFVVLLRGMDLATARRELPDLHARLSGRVSTPDGPVQFSAGAAVLREGEDWSRWLARADQALYAAKSDGRNCLVFSEP
ncbi:GGDEF domain-containing protein [Haliea atlantica]